MRREEKRTDLVKAIPLDTPIVVHIEVTNVCNFRCKFCYTSNDEIKKKYNITQGYMEYALFTKIIDDLKIFPSKVKRILFHVNGEPLLNKNIIQMIKYAKENAVATELVMFTNGVLLSKEISEKIVDAGLDKVQISVEGINAEKYKNVCGEKIDFEDFIKKIEYLYKYAHNKKEGKCRIHCKIIDVGMKEQDKEEFHKVFDKISDEAYIEQLLDICPEGVMDTTMGYGRTTTQEGRELKAKKVCTAPFYICAINYDGGVEGCACDWRRSLILGNVKEESLYDIWNGDKYMELRKYQLEGNRSKITECADCKAIEDQIDNIDDAALFLLKQIGE